MARPVVRPRLARSTRAARGRLVKRIPIDPVQGFQVVAGSSCAPAATTVLGAGQATAGPESSHDGSDRWLYVLQGSGRAVVAGTPVELEPGILLLIEAGEVHEIRNPGPGSLETLNLYAPPAC